jgi:hypothetical protein
MASLESLKNPVTRLGILGFAGSQSASFRRNEVNNSNVWDVTKQYYLNDIAFSGIDGGAYVMDGGITVGSAAPLTAILGGDDPAVDWTSAAAAIWVPLAANGPRVVEPAGVQSATLAAAGGALTFVNCSLLQAAVGTSVTLGDTNFMAHVQFAITFSAVATAAEWFNLTLAPTGGTAAPSVAVTVVPAVGVALQNVSVSAYVPLAADGTTTSIVLTGAMNPASLLTATIASVNVSYIPVVP